MGGKESDFLWEVHLLESTWLTVEEIERNKILIGGGKEGKILSVEMNELELFVET